MPRDPLPSAFARRKVVDERVRGGGAHEQGQDGDRERAHDGSFQSSRGGPRIIAVSAISLGAVLRGTAPAGWQIPLPWSGWRPA